MKHDAKIPFAYLGVILDLKAHHTGIWPSQVNYIIELP